MKKLKSILTIVVMLNVLATQIVIAGGDDKPGKRSRVPVKTEEPGIYFCGVKQGGEVSADKAKKASSFSVKAGDQSFPAATFKLIVKTGADSKETKGLGNNFEKVHKDILSKVQSGSVITFENVVVKLQNNKTWTIKSAVFSVK